MKKTRKSLASGAIFFLFISAGLLFTGCSVQFSLGRQDENSPASDLEPDRETATGQGAQETDTPETRVPAPLPPVETGEEPPEETPSERELPAADTGLPVDSGPVEVIIMPEDD